MYFYTISGLVEVLLLSIEFENDDAVLLICSGNVHLMCLLYRWLPAPSLALNNTVENNVSALINACSVNGQIAVLDAML